MASNAELIAQAVEISADLNLGEIKTDGLNNQQLAALVSDLKAKKRDAENATAADSAEKVAAAAARVAESRDAAVKAAEAKAKKKPAYYLAPRKAIATKRGILSGDTEDEITVGDLPGGEDALAAFIESGHILKG